MYKLKIVVVEESSVQKSKSMSEGVWDRMENGHGCREFSRAGSRRPQEGTSEKKWHVKRNSEGRGRVPEKTAAKAQTKNVKAVDMSEKRKQKCRKSVRMK